jgi:AmmeMemoRadiSam system protein A
MTSADERREILNLARQAVVAHVTGRPLPAAPLAGIFGAHGGAFVTLHHRGQLRGCIGHIAADRPFGRVIPECAVSAASEDPRFGPVTPQEIPDLDVEVSLLGPLLPIRGPEDIVVGRDGLVIEDGWHRGLLLPQVATEWGWDAETFLAQTCNKAGLPRDAWKRGAKLWRFEAEVFGESQTSSDSRKPGVSG